MTMKEYRQHPAANFSSLKHLLKSPAHYQAELAAPRKESAAFRLGTLVHGMVLEGIPPQEMFAIKPDDMSLATKDGKAWKAEQTMEIISQDEVDTANGMLMSVMDNPSAAQVLAKLRQRETPILASIQHVDCKALLDAHGEHDGQWYIADLKTTDDASPDAFGRKVAQYHYDLQAELYCQVLAASLGLETPPKWFWIVVEKSAPFTSAVYTSDEWRESGQDKLDRVLQSYKDCKESGIWPQPYQGVYQLPKPKWA